jgi:galactonate dehydratase
MKIWSFDEVAHANHGQYITAEELDRCLEPIRRVRDAVGRRMDVMIELHGLWVPLPAAQICRALEEYEPFWVEDAIKLRDLQALARLAESTSRRSRQADHLIGRCRAAQTERAHCL